MDKQLAQLEHVLREQLAANEALLSLLNRKREAMKTADQALMLQCCELEQEKVHLLGELEKQRLQLVAALTLAVEPDAAEPLRLAELAQRMEEPARSRLLVLRAQLVERMTQVRDQTRITHRALESLQRHMQGLMMTVGALCSGVATYGANGARPRAAAAVSTFSMTA